ncbi:MAG: cation:proton antiporter [Candidatus Omnitrophica bacterium]|nr:cation:proton antiporter [Candidatus Omnitrophota bacterium]
MVFIFSLLLMAGIVCGQIFQLANFHTFISFATAVCLAFIMIEVGLEFSIEKRSIRSYGWDSLIAAGAALLPAILWIGYFLYFLQSEWKSALLAGLSSAPTSAGVLFAMLSAAGLSATWVFKKARILAVLDDLITVLLLTPLAIVIHGFEWKSIATITIIGLCVFASFRWQNDIKWPVTKKWLLIYSFVLTSIVFIIQATTHMHLDVLIPAFMWGCLVKLPKGEHAVENDGPVVHMTLDVVIKGLFMMLVGLSLPKIVMGTNSLTATVWDVLLLTILANLGKLFLIFCYTGEANLKQRLALGIAMFPRGEVGAAVLLIGVGYGLAGYDNTLAVLSLALNLVLTGGFIWAVIKLLQSNVQKT